LKHQAKMPGRASHKAIWVGRPTEIGQFFMISQLLNRLLGLQIYSSNQRFWFYDFISKS